jgi:hypothetical protein
VGLARDGDPTVTADAQTLIALVNTNRLPNGSVTVMSWLPHGIA